MLARQVPGGQEVHDAWKARRQDLVGLPPVPPGTVNRGQYGAAASTHTHTPLTCHRVQYIAKRHGRLEFMLSSDVLEK